MDEETRIALDLWIKSVDNCIHELTEIIQKTSGHIIDHEVDITAAKKKIAEHEQNIDQLEELIKNLERRIEHIESSLNKSKWIELADPMAEMLKPTTASKGGNPTDLE